MKYLGDERSVTQDYQSHQVAEDYSGMHQSVVKMNGTGRVTKVVNKFHSHEDSINYNTFLQNQNTWWDGNYYHCVSITGKQVLMKPDEVGGNQIWIETYYNNQKRTLHFAHLDQVKVNVGQLVNKDTILGLQGNTGLVLSGKSESDPTYGTHVHFEVMDANNQYINPRKYASFEYETVYTTGSNKKDENKDQIHILVEQINIRLSSDETSKDLGDVFFDEYYDVIKIEDTPTYLWYKIKTNNGIEGYVASKKNEKWLEFLPQKPSVSDTNPKENPSVSSPQKDTKKLIFTSPKEDYYYIYLYPGDRLYLEEKD